MFKTTGELFEGPINKVYDTIDPTYGQFKYSDATKFQLECTEIPELKNSRILQEEKK